MTKVYNQIKNNPESNRRKQHENLKRKKNMKKKRSEFRKELPR